MVARTFDSKLELAFDAAIAWAVMQTALGHGREIK
jgi:hypothetical protein